MQLNSCMLRQSKFWLYFGAGWLILTNVGHTWGYYGAFVTRELLQPDRNAIYEAMAATGDDTLLSASFWTVLQMMALELTFFLGFAAVVTIWIARMADIGLHRDFAAIATLTFGFGIIGFLFIHPQINALIIAAGATVLYGLAWLMARTA